MLVIVLNFRNTNDTNEVPPVQLYSEDEKEKIVKAAYDIVLIKGSYPKNLHIFAQYCQNELDFLKYKNQWLSYGDVTSIMANNELTNFFISTYLNILIDDMRINFNVVSIDASVATMFFEEDSNRDSVSNIITTQADYIIMPTLIILCDQKQKKKKSKQNMKPQRHWRLFIADFIMNEFLVFDSIFSGEALNKIGTEVSTSLI